MYNKCNSLTCNDKRPGDIPLISMNHWIEESLD